MKFKHVLVILLSLILVMNGFILVIGFMNYWHAETCEGNSAKSPVSPLPATRVTYQVTPDPLPEITPAYAPTVSPGNSLSQASQESLIAASPAPIRYVTIEPRIRPTPIPAPVDLNAPAPKKEEYVTIYSIDNESLRRDWPLVSFKLENPPLIVDYSIIPMNITDVKYWEYKMKSTHYNMTTSITRPYENTWYHLIVRDKATGEIVAEDGFGRTYGFQSPRYVTLMKNGIYEFESAGDYGWITLTMNVKREGNIP